MNRSNTINSAESTAILKGQSDREIRRRRTLLLSKPPSIRLMRSHSSDGACKSKHGYPIVVIVTNNKINEASIRRRGQNGTGRGAHMCFCVWDVICVVKLRLLH